jgi:hypothetical protein
VNERLVPDEAKSESAGARLDDVVRRIHDDSGRLESINDLVDAVWDCGAHDILRALSAPCCDDDDRDDCCTDEYAEHKRHGHQPGGVHSD